ncbi:MAG: hypothetical protein H6718_04195 [Polyangiaceae bacterium]|nr:hypothetical protein [Polyangiaceae bacterium]
MADPEAKFLPGAHVQFLLGKREVQGTVVEDRGPLGVGGRKLVRVQIGDTEFEAPATDLQRLPFDPSQIAAIDRLLKAAGAIRRKVYESAFRMFQGSLRHVSLGLWPEHLAEQFRRDVGLALPLSEATAALDALTTVGALVKRPSGIYISTDWLLRYLDRRSKPATPASKKPAVQAYLQRAAKAPAKKAAKAGPKMTTARARAKAAKKASKRSVGVKAVTQRALRKKAKKA